ncbi:MAG TPA: HEPN domain-containing protein [Solirubrobacteraceae bacterium]|nr:HEPN domain-containing protein [Solirubrobacteraceae bacterium]
MANQHDLAKQLLQRASDDEAAARAMLSIESVTDMIVGMLAQQGVEKAIKAVLATRGVDFPFTHDIGGLTRICKEGKVPLPDDLDGADQLTPYAGALRYDAEDPKLVDRATALRWATAAVSWAQAQVESTAAPSAETEHQEGT